MKPPRWCSGTAVDGPPIGCVHNDGTMGSINRTSGMKATKVGVREFRSGLAEFIASAAPVAVTRHGQTVGYFIPTHGRADADMAAMKKASAALDRLLAAPSVDTEPAALELKAARKTGKGPRRKAASAARR